MSDVHISITLGESKRILTGGKFCNDDIVVSAVSPQATNLFNIEAPLFAAKDGTGNMSYLPKVENGVLYSGGQLGAASGAVAYVYVSPGSMVRFAADIAGESGYLECFAFTTPVAGWYSGAAMLARLTVNNESVNQTFLIPEGYQCFGFAAYSSSRYGMQLTNIGIYVEAGTAAEQAVAYSILKGDAV